MVLFECRRRDDRCPERENRIPARRARLISKDAIQGGTLITRDAKTGQIRAAGRKNDLAKAAIPVALGILLAMIVMMTSAPMLPAIAEDKMQRIYEMLPASATPFELIAGKVLAAIGRSLTSAAVYISREHRWPCMHSVFTI